MTYAERQEIHQQHRNAIIKFLMWERAVHVDVLATVIDRHANQATRILKKMEAEKIVVSALVPFWATKRTVWGLTHHGAAMATEFVREHENAAFIEVLVPNNLNTRTVDHRRGIQQIRALHLDSTSYLHANKSGLKNMSWGRSKPDLLWLQNGLWYAIEYEEHLKSYRRYQEIAQTYQTAADTHPLLIGGAIIVTKEALEQGLKNCLFEATKNVRTADMAIWTCVAGSPLLSSYPLRKGQFYIPGSDMARQEQDAEDAKPFTEGESVWFDGNEHEPAGIYRVLGASEIIIAVRDVDFDTTPGFSYRSDQYVLFNRDQVSRLASHSQR